MKKIALFGGTGFIGRHLTSKLKEKGYKVSLFSRNLQTAQISIPAADEYFLFNRSASQFCDGLKDSSAIINLAGAPINSIWTESYKKLIYSSRIDSTRIICEAISNCTSTPPILFNASAVGIYANSDNNEVDESGVTGSDFLAKVCRDWEAEANKAQSITRVINGRFGIILGKDEGALAKILLPFKYFIGGRLGSGRQWYPWIHIEDAVEMIIYSIENYKIAGPVNIVGPSPVQMSEFAKILGKVSKRPSFFPVPEFVLNRLMGEMSVIVTQGDKVIPRKATENGFNFKFNDLRSALEDLLV